MIDDTEAFVKVAEVLKDRGAYKVFVMATHGILSCDAPSIIEDSCIDEVSLGSILCLSLSIPIEFVGLIFAFVAIFLLHLYYHF